LVPVLAIWAFLRQAVAETLVFSHMPEFTNAAFLLDALEAAGTSVPLHAWRSFNTLSKWSAAALAALIVPVVVITTWGTWRLQADALARDVVPGEVFTAGSLRLHAIARAVHFIPEEVNWALFRCALAQALIAIKDLVVAANLILALANTSGSIVVQKAATASIWKWFTLACLDVPEGRVSDIVDLDGHVSASAGMQADAFARVTVKEAWIWVIAVSRAVLLDEDAAASIKIEVF
jgi:hypothetical protein